MDLDDKRWKELTGGYQTPYDASEPLKSLEQTDDQEQIWKLMESLWEELYHQGDIGTASYYAVPHLIRITIEKKLFDWRLIGLPLVIEHQRNTESSPDMPSELLGEYEKSLAELGLYSKQRLSSDMDDSTFVAGLSAIATASGRIDLGRALIELEDSDLLQEFLEQF